MLIEKGKLECSTKSKLASSVLPSPALRWQRLAESGREWQKVAPVAKRFGLPAGLVPCASIPALPAALVWQNFPKIAVSGMFLN